jgi:hypothetical protein
MPKIAAAFVAALLFLSGCKKHLACDPADSEAVCKQFQQCLRSDTSTEVCKMAEQDADKLDQRSKH